MPIQITAYYKLDYAPDGKFDGALDIIAQDKNGKLYKVETSETNPAFLKGTEKLSALAETSDGSYSAGPVYTGCLDIDGDKKPDHIRSPKGDATLHTTPSNANLAGRIILAEPDQDSDVYPNFHTDKLDLNGDGVKDHAEATNPNYSGVWIEQGAGAELDPNWRYAEITPAFFATHP